MRKNIDEIRDINDILDKVIINYEDGQRHSIFLNHLRTLIEHVAILIMNNGVDTYIDYDTIRRIKNYARQNKLVFISELYRSVEETNSHYILTPEASIRMINVHLPYLFKLRDYVYNNYKIRILNNLESFQQEQNPDTKQYYENISKHFFDGYCSELNVTRYYIHSKRVKYVNGVLFYEYSLTDVHSANNKMNRILAYSLESIPDNYSVKLSFRQCDIPILGIILNASYIDCWQASIRTCEIDHLLEIAKIPGKVDSKDVEYTMLMDYLTKTRTTLLDIVQSPDEDYYNLIETIKEKANKHLISQLLDSFRKILKDRNTGCNVISYLLYHIRNSIIRNQIDYFDCIQNTNLSKKCLLFDRMPFYYSLSKHNPAFKDVYNSVGPDGRDCEILANKIRSKVEEDRILFIKKDEIDGFSDDLVSQFNKLASFNSRIVPSHDYVYINDYLGNLKKIINILRLRSSRDCSLNQIILDTIDSNPSAFKSCYTESVTKRIFKNSSVAAIIGAAGTGKTTLIRDIVGIFKDKRIVCLTKTNAALNNLRNKVGPSCQYSTIDSYHDTDVDLIIIDECGVISNRDMANILNINHLIPVIVVGDPYQIEPIEFGNWFFVLDKFLDRNCVFVLEKLFRSDDEKLIEIWDDIRNQEKNIMEKLNKSGISRNIDESLFQNNSDDQVILCLNYGGLFGINNLNQMFQNRNPNNPVFWELNCYKIGDPILFNSNVKGNQQIYNNAKGTISAIDVNEKRIVFTIKLSPSNESNGNESIVQITVNRPDVDDGSEDYIVPFDIAYAVSIHKAQGLEYNSVKIIISDEFDELLSWNAFYTAVTRARKDLTIYWNEYTEKAFFKRNDERKVDRHRDELLFSNETRIPRNNDTSMGNDKHISS